MGYACYTGQFSFCDVRARFLKSSRSFTKINIVNLLIWKVINSTWKETYPMSCILSLLDVIWRKKFQYRTIFHILQMFLHGTFFIWCQISTSSHTFITRLVRPSLGILVSRTLSNRVNMWNNVKFKRNFVKSLWHYDEISKENKRRIRSKFEFARERCVRIN